MADTIGSYSFSFTDPNAGNLVASGNLTVDLTTNQALSGTGSINSNLFVQSDGVTPIGTQGMSLVTASSTNIRAVYADGSFLWTDSDGTNLQADTYFTPTTPYIDSYGLLFQVGAPTANGHYASFNFWYSGGSLYGEFLGNGGPAGQGQVYNISNTGTFTVSAVPLPATVWMLLSGLAGLGALARQRKLAA